MYATQLNNILSQPAFKSNLNLKKAYVYVNLNCINLPLTFTGQPVSKTQHLLIAEITIRTLFMRFRLNFWLLDISNYFILSNERTKLIFLLKDLRPVPTKDDNYKDSNTDIVLNIKE